MTGYREMRLITGQKVFVRISEAELRERRRFRAVVVTVPVVMFIVFCWAAGVI